MKILGKIVHGRGVGKTLGFPTANIKTNDPLTYDPGVYSAVIELNNTRYPAVVNIGSCPTFSVDKVSIEAHLIDFNDEIYGKNVILTVNKKLRDIIKFDNVDLLKKQIALDIENSIKDFS